MTQRLPTDYARYFARKGITDIVEVAGADSLSTYVTCKVNGVAIRLDYTDLRGLFESLDKLTISKADTAALEALKTLRAYLKQG